MFKNWWIYAVLILIAVFLVGVYFWGKNAQTQINTLPDEQINLKEYTSPKGEMLKVTLARGTKNIASPLTVAGEVRGGWSFEGDFPIRVADSTGKIIATSPATLQGEWMTENYVPFTSTLTFVAPPSGSKGKLILEKDNPSDMRELDDKIEIDISFK